MALRALEASGHVVASFLDQASTLHLATAARGVLVDEDGRVFCHTINVCPELWKHRINPREARVARFLRPGFVSDRSVESIIADFPGSFGFETGWRLALGQNALTRKNWCSFFAAGTSQETVVFRLTVGDVRRTFAHKFGDKYGSSNFCEEPVYPVLVRFDILARCHFEEEYGSLRFPSSILKYFSEADAFLSEMCFDRYKIIVFPHAIGLRLDIYGLVPDRRAFDMFLDGARIGTLCHNFVRDGEIACLPCSFGGMWHTVTVAASERRGDPCITHRVF